MIKLRNRKHIEHDISNYEQNFDGEYVHTNADDNEMAVLTLEVLLDIRSLIIEMLSAEHR